MVRRVALEYPGHRLSRLSAVRNRVKLEAGSIDSYATVRVRQSSRRAVRLSSWYPAAEHLRLDAPGARGLIVDPVRHPLKP
jgi:hypothetical protein